jgi:hypothetical protein
MKKITSSIVAAVIMIIGNMIPLQSCYAKDSLSISGKGMYIWQMWNANSSNLTTTINKLKSNGITWVVIKMGDGDSYYNQSGKSLYNWAATYSGMDSVISIFHSNGIKVLAFQYVYGDPHHWLNVWSETDVANWVLDVKGIDGLIIDAEIQYDTLKTRVTTARAYCDSIRIHHPNSFIGLTAWSRPNSHSTFPWTSFLDRVQVNMPQAYWGARPTTVQNELNLMSSQFISNTNTWVSQGDSAAAKPIMPIGDGYTAKVIQGDITSFCNLSQTTYNYPGVSLWEYNQIANSFIWNEYASVWNTTSVSIAEQTPIQYDLLQNYPNPFNPTTLISYNLPKDGQVTIKIFDTLGREIKSLVDEYKTSGSYTVSFNASKLASGVYYYTLMADKYSSVKKMILIK